MAAMASGGEEPNRRTASIANLLLPTTELAEKNLLSLSHLAASMQPAPTDHRASPSSAAAVARRRRAAAEAFARTRSVPVVQRRKPDRPEPQPTPGPAPTPSPPEQRRQNRLSRSSSAANAAALGVAHPSAKRISRTKSGNISRKAAMLAAASPATGDSESVQHASAAAAPATPHSSLHPPPSAPHAHAAATPSPTVLRPISSNPLAGYSSKHTSASNSVESCVPTDGVRNVRTTSPCIDTPSRKAAYQAAASRFAGVDYASNALARIRSNTAPSPEPMMDIDGELDQRDPSASSHDAKLALRARARTTPDAKRAQNRESAKRFRVAQKKRWNELQETVEKKDREIDRLKEMLQEATNKNLATQSDTTKKVAALTDDKADALSIAELGLFVKLMTAPSNDRDDRPDDEKPPLAANIGSLFRVIISRLDGSVLGVRHQNNCRGVAMGGEVGGCIWDHVHSSDFAHFRFSIVHVARMASVLGGEPSVFSYRRRELAESLSETENKEQYIRMKGCLYPLADEDGEITRVILAEFIEG